jgi:trigger factor
VTEIKDKAVPAKDDEFAKKVGFDKLEDLKGAIRHSMEHRNYDSAVRALGIDALKKLTDESEVEMPLAMVDAEAADMLNDLARRVEEQGLKWDEYLKSKSSTQDAMLEEMKPKAESAVKQQLTIRALLKENDMRVTAAEVDRAIEMMAGKPGEVKPAEIKRLRDNENVRTSVSRIVGQDKAIKLLSSLCDENPEEGKCTVDHEHEHKHDHGHEHEQEAEHEHEHGHEAEHEHEHGHEAKHDA